MKKDYSHYKKLKGKGDTEWELSKLKHTEMQPPQLNLKINKIQILFKAAAPFLSWSVQLSCHSQR